jgi:hypothetical protein
VVAIATARSSVHDQHSNDIEGDSDKANIVGWADPSDATTKSDSRRNSENEKLNCKVPGSSTAKPCNLRTASLLKIDSHSKA